MGEVEGLEKYLKSKGYRLTGPRRILLGLLEKNSGKVLSAQEIYDLLSGQAMNFSTVFRNLEMMAEEDMLFKIDRENGVSVYGLCLNHHHHHLICTVCGKTRCINICPMDLVDKSAWEGFIPKKHRFEIMGLCPECSKKNA